VSSPHRYELILTPPAVRAIRTKLPEPVAAAVIEFMTGALIDNPHRVGKPLHGDLAGIHAARRGTYRVLYRINDRDHEVVVLRIDHRQDVYRTNRPSPHPTDPPQRRRLHL
jgi:mRNA interferase RelE/StbE